MYFGAGPAAATRRDTSVVNATISASGSVRGSIAYTAGTVSSRTSIGCRRVSASASPSGPNFSRAVAFSSPLTIARR